MRTMLLTFTVEAVTEFEAIAKAAEMLRRGVVFVGVHECERASEPYWNVTLRVSEAA